MKRTITLFLLLSGLASQAGSSKHGPTFTQKDVFQTASFLKNVPGLISDYKDQPIRYFANHDGIAIYLTDAGPIYKLTQLDEKRAKEIAREKKHEHNEEKDNDESPTQSSFVNVKWLGANPHPLIEAIGKKSGYYTFLAGIRDKDLHTLRTNGYSKVIYHDLYPGIDVEYSFPDKGGMKYNLIVHPGADISKVKMEYKGAVKSLIMDREGNVMVAAKAVSIMEYAPMSFSNDDSSVSSAFEIRGKVISFKFSQGHDHNQTLIIDPWVTVLDSLTVRNLGTSVDYDLAGNLYVYGAGGSHGQDFINNHKVAKYDVNGNFLWVFMGSVPSVGWSSIDLGTSTNCISDARVDKSTNKIYVGQGINGQGAQVIRLTSSGDYDNFISVANRNYIEIWSLVYNCAAESIMSLGGGTTSNLDLGLIDTTSDTILTNNFTGISGTYGQDIVSGVYDAYGSLYVILSSVPTGTPSVTNVIFKLKSTYNGYIWESPSGFNTFAEAENLPGFSRYLSSNHYNALAANQSYLFYYDGKYLKAFDLDSGNAVGSHTSIPGYDTLYQGGIAVDTCNNIYVGGLGVIKTFTFDGSTFIAGADIPLGNGFSGDTINDVRYDPSSNLIYVAGSQIVGTYTASLSATCNALNKFSVSVDSICNGAIVQVTTDSGIGKLSFTYTWQDSAGTVLKQSNSDTILTDTFDAPYSGHYTIQVALNLYCGGPIIIDSVYIYVNALTVTFSDTVICSGQNVLISAFDNIPGSTYVWSPGGDTTPSITVSPGTTTTYHVTCLDGLCGSSVDSVLINVYPLIKPTGIDTAICQGYSITLNGSTYDSAGIYTSVLSSVNGCDSAIILTLTVKPQSHDTVDQNICSGDSIDFGGTYYSGPGMYNQVLTGSNGCDSNVTLLLTVNALPVIHWQQQDSIESCTHSTGLIALPAGGHYSGPYVSGDSIIDPPADTSFAVTYTYTDSDGCLATDMQRFFTGICTGIADIGENSGIRLYPNPNNGSFILRSNDCIGSEYTVYDMIGRMIARGTITADIQNISLIGIAMGSYTLEVKGNKAIRFVIGNG